MIKFEHTVFALPFALIGMLLGAGGWPSPKTLGWILVAMVGARSAAMAWNRLVDVKFDAQNPRTANRALPQGLLAPKFVIGFILANLGLFVLAAWKLHPLCFKLSPVAVLILLGYSYTKRFTWASHVFLGLALAGAPLGAWIAVRGSIEATPLLLGAIVLTWVAGFDLLYALQDEAFDRKVGLYSFPARFGTRSTLVASALLHVVTLFGLVLLPFVCPVTLGGFYWLGVFGCAVLLVYQHSVVRPGDLSRLNQAFFTANGALSLWLFLNLALDLAVSGT
jgi:4-hydroxybenzoate polyprenyltransferase